MDTLRTFMNSMGACVDYNNSVLVAILLSVGIFTLWSFIQSTLGVLFSLFIISGKPLSSYAPTGSWALITGASDGIGKEFAISLAEKGYNLLLVSRTQSKLDTLASEITAKYGPKITTKTLAMDFAQNKDSDYAALRKLIDGLDVGILINNVGQSHSIPVTFVETPAEEMKDIIMINCMATLKVTQTVAPGMVSRKRGLILTMASTGGWFPTPLLATYSGSKAFLQQWSIALGSELQPHGVYVQCVQSHLVTTAMSKIRKSSALVPNPRQFVKSVFGKLGRGGGVRGVPFTSAPYWSHGLMLWFITHFIGERNGLVLSINKKMHEGIRERALRKAARDAKKQ